MGIYTVTSYPLPGTPGLRKETAAKKPSGKANGANFEKVASNGVAPATPIGTGLRLFEHTTFKRKSPTNRDTEMARSIHIIFLNITPIRLFKVK